MSERVGVSQDERYPYFSLSDEWGEAVDVDAATVERWRSVMAQFERVQDEMEALYAEADQRKREAAERAKAEREAAEKAARAARQRELEESNRKRRKAVAKLVGTVYDAAGNPVGEVTEGSMGLAVKPLIQ